MQSLPTFEDPDNLWAEDDPKYLNTVTRLPPPVENPFKKRQENILSTAQQAAIATTEPSQQETRPLRKKKRVVKTSYEPESTEKSSLSYSQLEYLHKNRHTPTETKPEQPAPKPKSPPMVPVTRSASQSVKQPITYNVDEYYDFH
ncbi:hypothetical protein P9112_010632 [Eukaryota sp. TZLM1-RC]